MKLVKISKMKNESIILLVLIIIILMVFGNTMGLSNMLKTVMSTAHHLILNTCLYIMGVSVISGGLSGALSEFGVIQLLNKPITLITKPLYNLPGVSSIGILTTYLSDNPAIITLADNKNFSKYFKKYQFPAITNLGTSFGMGLVVSAYMLSVVPVGENYLPSVIIGNFSAVIGSVFSVRLMQMFTKKYYHNEAHDCIEIDSDEIDSYDIMAFRQVREGSKGQRLIESVLDGAKSGVKIGLDIIPGVVVITTIVLLITNGKGADGIYTGDLGEGIPIMPIIGEKLSFILDPLFGFTSSESILFPITTLGSVGAALGTLPSLITKGVIKSNDIAVFTAMGMCWSGYLSTHIAMMDALKIRELTSRAIISHTIGGLVAGIVANYTFLLYNMM